MGVTVGTLPFHGMIRFFVVRFCPQCASPSLKGPPVLYGRYRNVHTGGVDYDSEVESTPLLRIVRNRASEFSHLRSEVGYRKHVDRIYAHKSFIVV